MAINFPSAPAVNDTYTYNNKTWVYNGTTWVGATTGNVSSAGVFGSDNRVIRSDGTGFSVQASDIAIDDTTFAMYPTTNDVGTLGKSGNAWGDLFLASGGVINFNAGDVLVTHSANTLTFTGASSGYLYDAVSAPSASDGAALGTTSLMWSDLFLASGAVINFNNGDVTITHSSNKLDIDGGVVDFDQMPTVNDTSLVKLTTALASGSFPAANSVDIAVDMTGYSNLAIIINGMSHNSGTNRNAQIAYSDDGTNFNSLRDVTPSIAAAATANGAYILFGAGLSSSAKVAVHTTTDAAGATIGPVLVGETGITVEVRISLNSTGNFDAGTYLILGF